MYLCEKYVVEALGNCHFNRRMATHIALFDNLEALSFFIFSDSHFDR